MDLNIERLSSHQNHGQVVDLYYENIELFERELDSIKYEYPYLHYRNTSTNLFLEGRIDFDITESQIKENIKDSYLVQIAFPNNYPRNPPTVKEIGGRIPNNYHRNGDKLCLGVPSEVYFKFVENPTLLHFIKEIIEPYFYKHSLWEKNNGTTPFKERDHGGEGVCEYYSELFGIKDNEAIISLLEIAQSISYKQSTICPCGKRTKLKKCHGKLVLKIQNNVPTEILDYELRQINHYLYGLKI